MYPSHSLQYFLSPDLVALSWLFSSFSSVTACLQWTHFHWDWSIFSSSCLVVSEHLFCLWLKIPHMLHVRNPGPVLIVFWHSPHFFVSSPAAGPGFTSTSPAIFSSSLLQSARHLRCCLSFYMHGGWLVGLGAGGAARAWVCMVGVMLDLACVHAWGAPCLSSLGRLFSKLDGTCITLL